MSARGVRQAVLFWDSHFRANSNELIDLSYQVIAWVFLPASLGATGPVDTFMISPNIKETTIQVPRQKVLRLATGVT